MDVTLAIPSVWLAVIAIAALLTLVLSIWTVIDVARRPRWQLSLGQKTLWIVGMVVGWLVVWPVAAFSAIFYLVAVRKRLNAMVTPGLSQATWDPYAGGGRPLDLPDAGWYEDPAGGGGQRWWDGRGWSVHVRAGP